MCWLEVRDLVRHDLPECRVPATSRKCLPASADTASESAPILRSDEHCDHQQHNRRYEGPDSACRHEEQYD